MHVFIKEEGVREVNTDEFIRELLGWKWHFASMNKYSQIATLLDRDGNPYMVCQLKRNDAMCIVARYLSKRVDEQQGFRHFTNQRIYFAPYTLTRGLIKRVAREQRVA